MLELQFENYLIQGLGPIFMYYTPLLKSVYDVYLEGYDESRRRLQLARETNPPLQAFLKLQERCEGLSLESYLVTPIQRLPRYLLLLKELSRRAPKDAWYQVDLANAHTQLSSIASELNTKLSTSEQLNELRAIQTLFDRNDQRYVSFVRAGRKLIKEGRLAKKYSEGSYQLAGRKTYQFFLCNDLFFYASILSEVQVKNRTGRAASSVDISLTLSAKEGDKLQAIYKMKHMYQLADLTVDIHDPDAKKEIRPTELFIWCSGSVATGDDKDDKDDNKKLMLKAETEQERDAWFNAFKTAIANLKATQAATPTKRNKLL